MQIKENVKIKDITYTTAEIREIIADSCDNLTWPENMKEEDWIEGETRLIWALVDKEGKEVLAIYETYAEAEKSLDFCATIVRDE